MKTLLNVTLMAAGTSLILCTGCVSSRKYKASQADLAKVRNDSAQLAQQVSSLNGNVKDLQDKNSSLQQQVTAANNSTAATQKSLDYYQGYFKDQQNTMNQVSDDVKGALTQAGITNGDVQQVNNIVYVRLDENELFRKNSTMITKNGKEALNNLAQAMSKRDNINVFVGGGDSSSGASTAMASDNGNNNGMAEAPAHRPRHHRPTHHAAATASSSGNGQGSGASSGNSTAANNSSSGGNKTTHVHHRVHHHYSSEGAMAIYNRPGMHNHSWALKQGRMVAVANSFLKDGMNKVNVSLRNPPMNGTPDNTIKVVIMPKMEDFNPSNASATR